MAAAPPPIVKLMIFGSGVCTILLGILVLLSVLPFPPIVGYALVAFGFLDLAIGLFVFRAR